MFAIVALSIIAAACVVSVSLLVRDVRALHRHNRRISDGTMSAAGVAPAGMLFFDSVGTR